MEKFYIIILFFFLTSCVSTKTLNCNWNYKYTPAVQKKFNKHKKKLNNMNCKAPKKNNIRKTERKRVKYYKLRYG